MADTKPPCLTVLGGPMAGNRFVLRGRGGEHPDRIRPGLRASTCPLPGVSAMHARIAVEPRRRQHLGSGQPARRARQRQPRRGERAPAQRRHRLARHPGRRRRRDAPGDPAPTARSRCHGQPGRDRGGRCRRRRRDGGLDAGALSLEPEPAGAARRAGASRRPRRAPGHPLRQPPGRPLRERRPDRRARGSGRPWWTTEAESFVKVPSEPLVEAEPPPAADHDFVLADEGMPLTIQEPAPAYIAADAAARGEGAHRHAAGVRGRDRGATGRGRDPDRRRAPRPDGPRPPAGERPHPAAGAGATRASGPRDPARAAAGPRTRRPPAGRGQARDPAGAPARPATPPPSAQAARPERVAADRARGKAGAGTGAQGQGVVLVGRPLHRPRDRGPGAPRSRRLRRHEDAWAAKRPRRWRRPPPRPSSPPRPTTLAPATPPPVVEATPTPLAAATPTPAVPTPTPVPTPTGKPTPTPSPAKPGATPTPTPAAVVTPAGPSPEQLRAQQVAGLLTQAEAAMGGHQYDQAIGHYDEVLKLEPGNAKATSERANRHRRARRGPKALRGRPHRGHDREGGGRQYLGLRRRGRAEGPRLPRAASSSR